MRRHEHHHHHLPTGRDERGYRPERPSSDDDLPPGPRGPRGGHRGHRGGGPGPEVADDLGRDLGRGFGRPGGRGGRGPRARGDIRAAILLLLDEQPRHGYELIQEITERSSGSWTPSPGSIYPTLQVLEDEGLLTIEPVEGRRTASLTAQGATYVEDNRAHLGTPWESSASGHEPALALRQEILALKDAAAQMARVGSPAQHKAAADVLVAARKDLYRLLADDQES